MLALTATTLLFMLVVYAIFDQINTQRKKGNLPGPTAYVPFIGGLVEMVLDPESFWLRQDGYGPLSWNYLIGRLVIHTTDPDLSRKVLSSDSPDQLKMKVHPNAELILGSQNMAFMQGPAHKKLRIQLLPLFTRRALSHYISLQDSLTRSYISQWLAAHTPHEIEFRSLARDLNTMTSQKVFVGPYLSEEQMEAFVKDYQKMNEGFLAFPVNLPGTKLNAAIKAREKIVKTLTVVARESKRRMAQEGAEPKCLLDYWMEKTVKALQQAEEEGAEPPEHSSDLDIAFTVLDFLFASQDASTSSLVWTMAYMSEYPEVLEKVREEQDRLRPNDEPVTHDLIVQMTYTRRVIKEILRIRPPATLVPQEAQEDFPLTDDFTVPKGSLITPSLWASSYYGYSNPYSFDPDRFSEERGEDHKFSKSFLVFGAGAHACLGKEYAINHLMTFLALMASQCKWERRRTPASDRVVFGPTIYPADCLLTFSPRAKA